MNHRRLGRLVLVVTLIGFFCWLGNIWVNKLEPDITLAQEILGSIVFGTTIAFATTLLISVLYILYDWLYSKEEK